MRGNFYIRKLALKAVIYIIPAHMCMAEDSFSTQAKMYFTRKEYGLVEALLENASSLKDDLLLLLAESYFHLGKYEKAKKDYELLFKNASLELKEKIELRLFDIDLALRDLEGAQQKFKEWIDRKNKLPTRYVYELAKALVDRGSFLEGKPLLQSIPENTPYTMRARYMLATVMLLEKDNNQALELFQNAQKLDTKCVEDYLVLKLLILAEARIFYQEKLYEKAMSAYERIELNSPLGREASLELLSLLLDLAFEAQKRSSKAEEEEFLNKASQVFIRLRKDREIGFLEPELLGKMALIYIAKKRYSEAEKLYEDILAYYHSLSKNMSDENTDINIIPYTFIKDIPEYKELNALNKLIEENNSKLYNLEKLQTSFALRKIEDFAKLKEMQKKLLEDFQKIEPLIKNKIKENALRHINNIIAEIERGSAYLSIKKMNNDKKISRDLGAYQTNNFSEFYDFFFGPES